MPGNINSLASFNVPITYRGLPLGFVITNPHSDFVKITTNEILGPTGID
jgi:hypothetical protein